MVVFSALKLLKKGEFKHLQKFFLHPSVFCLDFSEYRCKFAALFEETVR